MTAPRIALARGPAGALPELAARYLEEYLDKIWASLERLDEDQIWWRPAPETNSAGNLVLHLSGNLSLWILSGVGGRPFERRRSEEFAADRSHGRSELLSQLEEVVAACRACWGRSGRRTWSGRRGCRGTRWTCWERCSTRWST